MLAQHDLSGFADRHYQLLNASSVMEAKDATYLAMNIKLLTYVSIFYLPLSFCATLWAVDSLSLEASSFVIATPVIALGTYFIVANLGHVTGKMHSFYKRLKQPIIISMKGEASLADGKESKWADRGSRFEAFKPERESIKPSEWWILSYIFVNPGETIRSIVRSVNFPWTNQDTAENKKPS